MHDRMTTSIYILRLKDSKYYVGATNDVDKRYREHRTGVGAAWTRKYAPLGIDQVIYSASPFDEDKYVKQYMSVYGIDSVRGGSYSQMVLDDAQKSAIEKELRTAEGSCMRCGRTNHFAYTCNARTDVDGREIERNTYVKIVPTPLQKYAIARQLQKMVWYESDSDSDEDSDDDDACFRCGREGHWVSDCYARRHANGFIL